MANLKNITELPMAESADGLNLIVNDNGAAKQMPASAVSVQADWNQNDSTKSDYVKNRPFYEAEDGEVHKIPEKYLPDSIGAGSGADLTLLFDYNPGSMDPYEQVNMESGRIISGTYEEVVTKLYNGLPVKVDMYAIYHKDRGNGVFDNKTKYGIATYIDATIGAEKRSSIRFEVLDFFPGGISVYVEPDGTTHREWD